MSIMDKIFGKKKSPTHRERMKMQQQEKKLIREMRQLARQNQMEAVRIIAQDLVRTRGHVRKFYQMKAQMQAVSLRLMEMNSSQKMAHAMKGVSRTMRMMNARMNIPQMQRIMQSFAKENDMFTQKNEMMSDMIDDTMEEDNEEEDTNELVNSVLDEIGIDISNQIGQTGTQIKGGEKSTDDDLEARLNKLRGS